eukprot:4209224-Ditylum_brightwellii.AAC.1
MFGEPVKGTTVLFGDNKSMITNTSLSHSSLKKQVSVNNYHCVREAVASRIASIVYGDAKYNLADMGTKSLNGACHQFPHQNFLPVLTAGECKTNMEKQTGVAISGTAKYVHTVLIPLKMEVVSSFKDE